jgi:hypothetical protein
VTGLAADSALGAQLRNIALPDTIHLIGRLDYATTTRRFSTVELSWSGLTSP